MAARTGARSLLWLLAGFTVWSSAFLSLYILHALGCEWGWNASDLARGRLLRAVLLGTWALHGGLLVALTLAAWRRRTSRDAPRHVFAIAFGLCVAALVSTVWIGLPVLALPLCG